MPFAAPIYDPRDPIAVRATGGPVVGARLLKIVGPKVNGGNIPVAHCTAADEPFVASQQDTPEGRVVSGYRNGQVLNLTASGAITAGKGVQCAADGKVAQLSSGVRRGIAVETATADGDVILVALDI